MSRWLSKLEGVLNEVDQTGAKLLHAERDESGDVSGATDDDTHRVHSDAAVRASAPLFQGGMATVPGFTASAKWLAMPCRAVSVLGAAGTLVRDDAGGWRSRRIPAKQAAPQDRGVPKRAARQCAGAVRTARARRSCGRARARMRACGFDCCWVGEWVAGRSVRVRSACVRALLFSCGWVCVAACVCLCV
jgi:hypothetical protein